MEIPKQLQNPEFRFVLLKSKSKVPFEKDWQKNGYKFDDPKLQNWIKVSGNYGVIGGYGNLRILDIDKKELAQNFEVMFDTFEVETGSGGRHFYFLSDYEQNRVLIEEVGELRANNYQVVGVGSTHPNGKKYKVYIDKDIKYFSKEEVQDKLKPFLRDEVQTTDLNLEGKDTSGSGLEFRRVLALIREKKSRKVIYKEMLNYRKWASSGDDYKNLTYNKAYDIFLKEKEPEEEKPKEKISEIEFKKRLKEAHNQIVEILKYYLDLKKEYYSLIAVWVLGTYFHKEFSSYPYLYFNAMKGSGKTRALNLISHLTPNGILINSISEAVLFRTASQSTFCMDEFEMSGTEKNALMLLLNSSYKIGGKVRRMVKKKTIDGESQEVEEYDVYCPIALANIRGLQNVLEDRCITLILEKSNNSTITKLIEDFDNSPKIMRFLEQHSHNPFENGSVGSESDVQGVKQEWNNFIKFNNLSNPILHSQLSQHSLNSQHFQHSLLYNHIYNTGLSGRDLELFFPLFVIANFCGKEILNEILNTSKIITNERKEKDVYESKDVQLYDFISQQEDTGFIAVGSLTQDFRKFLELSEKEDNWVNSRWLGLALKRLVLVKEKKKSGAMKVILDIEKSKEKIRMFKPTSIYEEFEGENRQWYSKIVDGKRRLFLRKGLEYFQLVPKKDPERIEVQKIK